MIQLAADLSDPLLEVLDSPAADRIPALVDGVEVGPWFSPAQVRAYRDRLPDLPFYFHGGDLISRVGLWPGAASGIQAYLAASASPWLSLHLTLWPPGAYFLMRRWGIPLPRPQPKLAARAFLRKVQRLRRTVTLPILLENVDPLPFPGCEFEVDPGRIRSILEAADCGLLLDVAHARCAAAALGLDAQAYLSLLPLERVVQLHVSGPRRRGERLVDAHQPLEEADYALLTWLLERTQPTLVTLEYIREVDPLLEQLVRLRQLSLQ